MTFDPQSVIIRIFVHSSRRRDHLPISPGLSLLFRGEGIKDLSDAHGHVCSWGSASIIHDLFRRDNIGFVVAGTFGSAEEFQSIRPKYLLDRPLKSFSLSVRLQGCFERARIVTLGNLLQTSEAKLLHISNFGRKCRNEVLEFLAELSLLTQMRFKLGMSADSLSVLTDSSDLPVVYLHSLRTVDSLGLPQLETDILHRRGLRFVAELMRSSMKDLETHLTRDQLEAINDALHDVSLCFGLHVPEWQRTELVELASIFQRELQPYEDAKVRRLELELISLLDGLGDVRRRQIALRFWGWDGLGGGTLEQVGQEFGLTRERVRQIVARVPRPENKKQERVRRIVREALRLASSMAPCTAESVEEAMLAGGLTSRPFRVEGLVKAAEILTLPLGFAFIRNEQQRLVVAVDDQNIASDILGEARRRISHYGLTTVGFVADALVANGQRVTTEQVRNLIILLPSLVWLDDDKEWFWSESAPRNSLLTRLRKVLTVAREISVSGARDAILRDDRMRQVELPEQVLCRLCTHLRDCCTVRAEILSAHPSLQASSELSDVEQVFVDVLRKHGGILERSRLHRECCAMSGVNPHTLDRYLDESPILVAHNNSLYGLVGIPFEVALIHGFEGERLPSDERHAGPPSSSTKLVLESDDHLIDDLDPNNPQFVWRCAGRIISRATQLRLLNERKRWSLVELVWSEGDVANLRKWGSEAIIDPHYLASRTMENEQLRITGLQSLALVFLALSADVGRMCATEGELWPYVHRALNPATANHLFIARNVPKPQIRELTEGICAKLGIRNAFGQEGAPSWMRTVYLQFGITLHGLERLPLWLTGLCKPTVTISDLLEDPDLFSLEFRKAWLSLQELRRGIRDQTSVRAELAHNPWIARSASDPALALTIRACQRNNVEVGPEEQPVATIASIFEKKRLLWQGDEPLFELAIARAWPDQFTGTEYAIEFKGLHRGLVKRDEDGHFLIDRPIIVPTVTRVIPVDILTQDSSVLESPLQLALCSEDDELLLFDLDRGDQLDIWDDHMNLKRGCAILCKSDLVIRPEATRVRRVFSGDWTIHCYPAGIAADCRVQLEDQILWTPASKQLPTVPRTPTIDVVCSGGTFGHGSHLRVVTEQPLNIRALHVGRQLLRPHAPGYCSRLEFELLPDVDYNRAKASVIVEENSRLRRLPARFFLQAPVNGAAIEHAGTWHPVNGNEVLDRADLLGRRLLVKPPSHWHGDPANTEDWALLEGSSFCARLRRFYITSLDTITAGLGQPLSLNIGPYNNNQPGIPLARAVLDSGILQGAHSSDSHCFLQLRYGIELTSDHQALVWLLSQSSPTTLPRCSWSQQGRTIVVSNPPENVIAYAVAYKGAWLGSHSVSPEHVEFVELINAVGDWPNLARWLQWWRLPLLYESVREAISRRICREPLETFLAWFSEDEGSAVPPMRLSHPNWQIVMRELFWGWRPSSTHSSEILRRTGLLSGDPIKDIPEGWAGLSELVAVNPVLAAAVASKGVPILYSSASQVECRSLCMIACNEIADLPRQSADLPRAKQLLISEAARQMRVDRSFIEKGLFREALELYNGEQCTTRNLRVALAVQPFRQWLTIQLIEQHC